MHHTLRRTVLLVLGLSMLTASLNAAEPQPASLPTDLEFAARAGLPFLSFRMSDVLKDDFWKAQSEETRRKLARAQSEWEKFSGVPGGDSERVVVLFSAFPFEIVLLARTTKPTDHDRVRKAVLEE